MIPDIGVMIAAYIVTRMAALLGQPRSEANVVAKILAAITIIVTVFCAADLVLQGSLLPNIARGGAAFNRLSADNTAGVTSAPSVQTKGSTKPDPAPGKGPTETSPIEGQLLAKGFQDSDPEHNIYQQFITMRIGFKNDSGKNIRAFDGVLTFTDLLGNPILSSRVAINDPIAPDGNLTWKGEIEYNQFLESHRQLRAENSSNLKIQFVVKKVLFADGTTKDY